ncbi:MAG: ArnT family glycosyltransferase [Lachnospiraceae bacterium]
MKQKYKRQHLIIIPVLLYIFFYALISGSFLTQFPFVHSDEVWLASLTRDMQASQSLGVTESFFDLKPRVPHAIKLLFHALQMGYLDLFGFHIQSVRLLSLTAGLICLVLLYRIGKEMGGVYIGAGLMVLVSLNVPFIYASHFARQEIILCVSLLACMLLLMKSRGCPDTRQVLLLAVMTGLSVGIHPNSFLCAAVCGCVILAGSGPNLRKAGRPLLLYTIVTGGVAAVFIGISFLFSPSFIPDYFRYGEQEFELSRTASGRLSQFLYYFKSIYARESGTYYVPDQRLELILIAVILVLLLLIFLFLMNSRDEEIRCWCHHTRVILAAVTGLLLGMAVIGRYNQTSIVFLLLPGWIAILQLIILFERSGRMAAIGLTIILLAWSSYIQITPFLNDSSYDHYLEQLGELVPADATAIANLNTGFYFEQGKLRDYRNLPYLKDLNELEHYINENNVQYICLTDELDYIYENRPYYNVIYGNAAFIKDLKTYCESSCILVGSLQSPLYGPRIIHLTGQAEYATVTVYRVVQEMPPAVP